MAVIKHFICCKYTKHVDLSKEQFRCEYIHLVLVLLQQNFFTFQFLLHPSPYFQFCGDLLAFCKKSMYLVVSR